MSVTRRALIGSGAALAGAMTASVVTAGPPIQDGGRALRRFIKMRGSLDSSLVIGFVSGRYVGVVDSEVTPLFGLAAATFSRYRLRDGGYDVVNFEQAYFTDYESGEVLDRFINPYTSQTVEVPVTSLPPTRLRILPDLRFEPPPHLPPGLSLSQSVEPARMIADEIVHVEHVNAVLAAKPGQRPFRYSETTTLRARLRDVDNPALTHAPCQTSFDAVVSWRPWLKMGDRPGAMLGSGVGGYGANLEALPASWLKATARLRPELLAQPGASLDGLFN